MANPRVAVKYERGRPSRGIPKKEIEQAELLLSTDDLDRSPRPGRSRHLRVARHTSGHACDRESSGGVGRARALGPDDGRPPASRAGPGGPYAVEALVEIGDHEQAVAIAEDLEDAEPMLGRWRGPALRARALALAIAFSDRDHALALFEAALDTDRQLGSAFEIARTLLARGRVLRRWRRRHAARESLEAALSRFEEMGAQLWAVRVAGDLERTAAYRTVNGEVAPSDAQIARLAASGRTNREIAQTLFVSTKTVEAALSRVYGTLGVRSRAELAALRTSL